MIVGLGTDLVDVGRFSRAVERHGAGFLQSLFRDAEIDACSRLRNRDEHLAARFAAREAALKSLGTGLVEGMSWKDMEVVPGEAPGVFSITMSGGVGEAATRLGARKAHLALAVTGNTAVATVVLEA